METAQQVSNEMNRKQIMKKKKTRFFEIYISKLLKEISPQNGMTTNSKQQLNSVLCYICRIISNIVVTLTEISGKKTISDKEVKNALLILLPVELANLTIEQCDKAKETYQKDLLKTEQPEKIQDVKNTKGSSRQEKAGILFPPAQVEKFLRNFGYLKVMVTNSAPVYLACAMEFLSRQILSNAINYSKDNKRVRITIRDLEMGIRNDSNIDIFFKRNNISFLGGGVIPYIHPSLMTKKNRKKRTKKNTDVVFCDTGIQEKKHRFRPGTVSLREIKKFQKMSNCLTFAKFPFEKFVREIVSRYTLSDSTMKISKEVFIILQYFIEQKIVDILHDANFATIHAGRVKLIPVDIEFVHAISSSKTNPYRKFIQTETQLENSAKINDSLSDVENDLDDLDNFEDTEEN